MSEQPVTRVRLISLLKVLLILRILSTKVLLILRLWFGCLDIIEQVYLAGSQSSSVSELFFMYALVSFHRLKFLSYLPNIQVTYF